MGFLEKIGFGEKKKTLITAENLALGLVPGVIKRAHTLFGRFEEHGFTAKLSTEQKKTLAIELFAFEVVCIDISMVRIFGVRGYDVGGFVARSIMTFVAVNFESDNVPEFIDAGISRINSHLVHYSQDIWDIVGTQDINEFNRMAGLLPPLGRKILRKILHSVAGISLDEPQYDPDKSISEIREKSKEANKEWEEITDDYRGLFLLTELVFQHAILSSSYGLDMAEKISLVPA